MTDYQTPHWEPPRQRRRSHKVRNSVLGGIGALVVIIVVAAAASGSHNSSGGKPDAQAGGSTPAAATSSAPPPPATPDAKGTSTESCNYTLSQGDSPGGTLTGEIDVTNTGNIGIVVKATEAWPQQGSNPITLTKTVKVPYGASGQPVMFNYPADYDVISNLQNWEQGHNYPQDDCQSLYKTTITGTYGPVH